VFFVRNLGFCETTEARRIGFAEALVFEHIHEQSYRRFGYELVEVPPGQVATRTALVAAAVARTEGAPLNAEERAGSVARRRFPLGGG
jgi:hypothetical protein